MSDPSPYSARRDSNAGADTAFGEPGDEDKLLKSFTGGATAADQRDTTGDDRESQPAATRFTYPFVRGPGGRLAD